MYLTIINGPNLNLLGRRNPSLYGSKTFDETLAEIRADFEDCTIEYVQSNSEGEIIDAIHRFGFDSQCGGIVLNPGAYAHYSEAIADAVEAVPTNVIEVHISNIFAREDFRRRSVTARAAKALISGCGRDGYAIALLHLMRLHNQTPSK